jgi:hypothetical protein
MDKVPVEKLVLVACAPPRCQCPEVEMDFFACTVEIRDDFGGRCCMTFGEFAILARKFLHEV